MIGPLSYGILSSAAAAIAWTPASPTTSGGVSPHTWHYADSGALYQDSAKTTPVASDGDVIGASVNQGSDTHDVVQATTANKPLYKTAILNGKPVFRFDGVGDFLQGALAAGLTQPFTMFAVAQLDASAVNDNNLRYIVDGDDISNRTVLYQRSIEAPDKWAFFAGVVLQGSASDSDWNIWAALANSTSSQFWHNGTSEASGDAGTQEPDGLTIGGIAAGDANFWPGDIAEILIYDSDLSNADKNQVGQYLADHYGLTWSEIT